ncbi:hypothetical protein V0288_07055 [Pannus brasiliensis CCIBt3594]|uniref:Uncharacterized protein n=1 Tax=Pannus brasiliensis CCIBt3594 TaxID=1427578 RepID=A0AAW9QW19_9CHRO
MTSIDGKHREVGVRSQEVGVRSQESGVRSQESGGNNNIYSFSISSSPSPPHHSVSLL